MIGIIRHRLSTDGDGVTTLAAFHGCPLRCCHCLNPQSLGGGDGFREYTPEELYAETSIDNLYFLATHGGVTFGGGEPCLYPKFICDFRKLCGPAWFFKLVKALFIVQSELPNYYEFQTRIDKQGSLEFYYNDQLMKYDELSNWVNDEYRRLLDMEKKVVEKNNSLQEKLSKLKKQSQELDIEYLSKEKQISTFLECKKTFFGKVKYFFKYSGKKNKVKEKVEKTKVDEIKIVKEKIEENLKVQYTLEELIQKGKETLEKENNLKNTKMDINALKLKNLNLTKKIENATAFIEEIDSHKKSIFEFWKYSNKDEVQALEEGDIRDMIFMGEKSRKYKTTFKSI